MLISSLSHSPSRAPSHRPGSRNIAGDAGVLCSGARIASGHETVQPHRRPVGFAGTHVSDIQRDEPTPPLVRQLIADEAVEPLRRLLKQGLNPDIPDHQGFTPLIWSIFRRRYAVMKLLLEHGADPNLPDRNGTTPLLMAIDQRDREILQTLLDHGADPNLPDSSKTPPLFRALQQRNLAIIETLLTHGADPNSPDPSQTPPLFWALRKGDFYLSERLLAHGANPEISTPSQQLFLHFKNPRAFLAHMTAHQKNLLPEDISALFSVIYHGPESLGKNLLPELLALLPLYTRRVEGNREKMGIASACISRLYDFMKRDVGGFSVDHLLGIALPSWGKVGILGLSFSRFKYDTMGLWTGAGPSEKPPLLVQSGLFQPVSARPDDARYFKGFVHEDPASGLSIELRRAYLVISKPGLGSVVIRNSSHDFGRNLFPEPAYYHPEKTYRQGKDLLNPADLLSDNSEFMSVLGKDLNRYDWYQALHHGKIQALLGEFQGVMNRYTQWKCGFKDGIAPEGFKAILEAAVLSTAHDGAMGPFKREKNLRLAPRLAWVNPYELPAPVASLDLSQPEIFREAELYLKVLKGQAIIKDAGEYATKLPKLTAFLAEGLGQGLELVLSA